MPKPTRADLTGYASDLAQCLKMWELSRQEAHIVAKDLLAIILDRSKQWKAASNYAETQQLMTELAKGGKITLGNKNGSN